jgi:hypothetical protein
MKSKALTFIEQVRLKTRKNHPEVFAAKDAIYNNVGAITTNRQAVHEFKLKTKAAFDAAVQVWYQNNTLENFFKVNVARLEYNGVIDTENYLAPMSELGAQHTQSREAVVKLLDCIRVYRDELAESIRVLNDSENSRLAELGLDPGEHPSVSALRSELSQLANAIVEIENYLATPSGSGNAWNHFQQLINF